ncbi:PhzF family phenazine biosynthesis protein [Falsiroseomonas sp. CW058]|uniref:PhzF family phenazine biosynthesis protein n=1 Tax=Falsiroseomonas sp. CW058 TaxID=3388664 RepID=UPI003D317F38
MTFEYETCDVFTTTRFGGNPLAVVYGAEALDGAAMQRVAREFNLSETVFVLPATEGNDAFLRIFTPGVEVPFAGHPNVGAAVMLARRMGRRGRILLGQAAGLVVAELTETGGEVAGARITAPRPFARARTVPAQDAAACAALPAGAVAGEVVVGGCGLDFALAEVADAAVLARAVPDIPAFRARMPLSVAAGLHLFTRLAPGRLRARMLTPIDGIGEDPATGSANCALGGLLLEREGGEALEIEVEQGVEMGRPSLLHVTARRGADGIRVTVGGGVVPVAAGRIWV